MKRSKETIEKMSQVRRGKHYSLKTEFKKGFTPWNKGRKVSVEEKSKMNLSGLSIGHGWNKGKKSKLSGEKHPMWGKKHSSDSLRKMSLARAPYKGINSTHYIDGRCLGENRKIYMRIKHREWKNIAGSFHPDKWTELKKRYDYMCLCCKRQEPEISLTMDHIIPVSKWNKYIENHPEILYKCNDIDNIQPLCVSCNSSKQTKVIDYREDFKKLTLKEYAD